MQEFNIKMDNMKKSVLITLFIASLFTIVSCNNKEKEDECYASKIDWETKETINIKTDSLKLGISYLPVYSHIYHRYDNKTFDLTITVSMRNISLTDTIYILKADYYNTAGDRIREYINKPVFILPMETLEIVINEDDKEGGSGGNFVFDWAIRDKKHPPLFEAVMISTYGQQGLSFTTRGVQIY
jgi:hypothetical protein